jgi:hypothetical protein
MKSKVIRPILRGCGRHRKWPLRVEGPIWAALFDRRLNPLIYTLDEISWLLPNGPELAGSAISVPVSAETNDGHRRVLAELSLASQSCFPETSRFDWLQRGQSKYLTLTRPFGSSQEISSNV